MASIAEFEQAVATAASAADRVRALVALATELARTGDARRAIDHAREARALALEQGDRALDAATMHALARCHFYRADFVAAMELLIEATRLYQGNGDAVNATIAAAGVGHCQYRLGAYEDAIVALSHALPAARELGIGQLEINIHNALGTSLTEAGRPDEADDHFARGMELARQQSNDGLLTKLLLNQALVDKRRGDDVTDAAAASELWKRAQATVLKALELARRLGNPHDEAYCLGQSGTMHRLLGQIDEARATLSATLTLGRELDDAQLLAEVLIELARVEAGRDAAAERRYLDEAIALAGRINARRMLADASEALSEHFERIGDAASALTQYKHFHAVREQALVTARHHALRAGQLWVDFQQATRAATRYREEAQSLADDKARLAREAAVLTEVSQQDPLTGLLNRRGMEANLDARVAESERTGMPLTIVLIDVDRFKTINDEHSHAVGDAVLERVGAVIRDHCRSDDLPVRYGGDEFLVVLTDVDGNGAARVLQRLKETIDATSWDAVRPGLMVTLSIGAACHQPGVGIAATIARADRALYEAKAQGRDRIVVA